MKRNLILLISLFLVPATMQAAVTVYSNAMSGPQESPPNASPGTGTFTITVDNTLNTLRIEASFTGLTGTTSAAHIHASATMTPGGLPPNPTAGVAVHTPSLTDFPLGVTFGTYDRVFDMLLASSYNPSYVTANGGTVAAAWAALQTQISEGRSYLNIHSNTFPGGEIRGILLPIPEPGSAFILGLSAAGLALSRRRRA